jgi:D-alanine--poly(phosphoribitol) ligase subunit 1
MSWYLENFFKICADNPNEWYSVCGERQISRGDFLCAVNEIISVIKRKFGQNKFIPIKCDKTAFTPCYFFACHLLGKAYVPIPADVPLSREQTILSLLDIDQSLDESETSKELGGYDKEDLDDALRDLQEHVACLTPYDPDAIAYILFTSGSTGVPKGVQISFENVKSFIEWTTSEYSISSCDVFLNQVPFTFDLSVLDLYSSFINGSKIVCLNKESSLDFSLINKNIIDYEVTCIYSTPSFLKLLSHSSEFKNTASLKLKKVLICGEVLTIKTATRLFDICVNAKLFNLYGPTETNVVTSQLIDKQTLGLSEMPIGRAMSDYHLTVLNDSFDEISDGEEGQLAIRGASVASGYFENPQKTSDAFKTFDGDLSRTYLTGDNVVRQENQFFYRGRIDNQFKFSGYRIEAGEIEAQISKHPDVKDAIVFPIRNNSYTVTGILAAIESKNLDLTDTEVIQHLKKNLPSYMLPTKIWFCANFPITSHGKKDRSKLEELVHARN